MIVYKLTNKDRKTHGGFEWGPEGWAIPPLDGDGPLCSKHWYHAYEHPLLAVLHDSIHGGFGKSAQMFEVHVAEDEILREGQMKLGFRRGVVGKQVNVPKIEIDQHIRYAIACAASVYDDKNWMKWAQNWILGIDSSEAAPAAREAAAPAARAEAAAWAAAAAAWAAVVVAWAAEAAAWAAEAAAWAAWAADINLIRMAEWAVSDSTELPLEKKR